jgi:ubiquinone/menaquinone biosynthesis C-methylase UbiE
VSRPLANNKAETERVRELQDRQAPRYDRQISFFERVLFGDGRQWATSQVRGDVLEIATGTGRNFEHYPAGTKLTAMELSREMLAIARERAEAAEIEIDLHEGDAQELEFPDESFDTVLITLALCTIPDDRKAAEEAYRVLRPGGRLVAVVNSETHLQELRRLFSLAIPSSITRETGAEILGRHFASVETRDGSGTVTLHDASQIRAYFGSSIRLKAWADRVPELDEPLVVRRRPVVFVAEKATS